MHWRWPLLVFSFLLSFTTVFYHFRTPETIAVSQKQQQQQQQRKPSFWGAVDSDFDWCERNNEFSVYVSEPWNSATSTAYPLAALYAYRAHTDNVGLSFWHKLMLGVTSVMGIGSVIFHGTLRYRAQLLDELPLYAMAVLAAAALRQRAKRAPGIQPAVACWAATLASVILFSPRASWIHELFRGIMTVTFSIAFIFIFTAGSVAGDEIDTQRGGGDDGAVLFRNTFVLFVGAIISWVLDIVACHELQALPIYPNLHAFGWHVGTCLGLLQLFCLMLLHQHTVRDGRDATVRMHAYGLLPQVVVAAVKSELKPDVAKGK